MVVAPFRCLVGECGLQPDTVVIVALGRQHLSCFAKRDTGFLLVATTHTQARSSLPAVLADFAKAVPEVSPRFSVLGLLFSAGSLLATMSDLSLWCYSTIRSSRSRTTAAS